MLEARLDSEHEVHQEVMQRLPLTGRLVKEKSEKNGRTLYLVGEDHHSGDAVNYVHSSLVPKIKPESENWIMLREGLGSYSDHSDEDLLQIHPSFLYFRKLPDFLDIPVDDSIGIITSKKTQGLIVSSSDLTVDELRGWYVTNFIGANRGSMKPDDLKKNCARVLNVSLDELDRASKYAYNREVHERLMSAWNKVSKGELDRILEENPNRKNVLVCVGAAHLNAFSDEHKYIG